MDENPYKSPQPMPSIERPWSLAVPTRKRRSEKASLYGFAGFIGTFGLVSLWLFVGGLKVAIWQGSLLGNYLLALLLAVLCFLAAFVIFLCARYVA